MTTIRQAQQMVAEFHAKLQVGQRAKFERVEDTGENSMLYSVASSLLTISRKMERWSAPRTSRAHLLVEELGECVEAMSEGDEEKFLDALADLLYVLFGTAETFDMPLMEAFEEVHRSNMTKEKQPDDAAAHRIRKKGPNYQPPNIARVLRNYREASHLTRNMEAPGTAYD